MFRNIAPSLSHLANILSCLAILSSLFSFTPLRPCISIASATYELLDCIKSVIGKGAIKLKINYNNSKHKDCYSYILKHDDAIQLMTEIYPYLIINSKRRRSELILNNYKSLTPRNGRYSDELLKAKLDFYDEFISIK